MRSIAIDPEMLPECPSRSNEIDYSKPCLFDLNEKKPNKTVDIGGHGLSLSLDAQGRVRFSLAQGTPLIARKGVTSQHLPCKIWYHNGKQL
jgi:hypothetical protein